MEIYDEYVMVYCVNNTASSKPLLLKTFSQFSVTASSANCVPKFFLK